MVLPFLVTKLELLYPLSIPNGHIIDDDLIVVSHDFNQRNVNTEFN